MEGGNDRRSNEGMVMVMLDGKLLSCPICSQPLVDHSPIYQCNAGHIICDCCRKKLAKHCPSCSACTVYRRCISLQNIVDSATVCCVNSLYGCKELLSFAEKKAHEETCMYFPCFCPKTYCNFHGSKEMLVGHLAVEHNLYAERFSYNLNFKVYISRLSKHKVLISDHDKSIFILQTIKQEQGIVISCVCIRRPNFHEPAFSWSLSVLKTAKHGEDSNMFKSRINMFKSRMASTTFEDGVKNDQVSLLVPLEMFPSVGALKVEICIKEDMTFHNLKNAMISSPEYEMFL
ncbi:putative E3 ubiquitin-protein ligase SINA-like 6 [Carex littledalei]|uniref:RING-type E3 ubiquitin transferase n=1 Tax=Carex littledalei TaxID=544730 RepID=A0A833R2S1_9POAL|nr:putative E3 ubiquitin-protein ligase SINA-like 6 [Carex littledalei]